MLEREPENPGALILRAEQSIQRKDYAAAVSQARRVLRNRPNSTQALGLLARAHMGTNSLDLAKENFLHILALRPQSQLALLNLASIAVREGDGDAGQGYAATALRANPESSAAAQLLVTAFALQGNTKEAVQQAQFLADSESNAALGTYVLAAVHFGNQDYEKAAGYFEETLQREPLVREALVGLTNSLVALGKREEAYDYLGRFRATHPEVPRANLLLAALHAADGNGSHAIELLKNAIEIDPTLISSYEQLGKLYAEANNNEQALATFEQGLLQSPEALNLVLLKAQVLESTGKFAAARNVYERALRLNSDSTVARNNLAVLLSEHDGGDDALQRALTLMRPYAGESEPVLLDTLGWIYHKLGEPEQAVFYLQKAIDYGGNDPLMHFHLGMARAGVGATAQARLALEQALVMSPTFTGAEWARAALEELR